MTTREKQTDWLRSIFGKGLSRQIIEKIAAGQFYHELVLHQLIREVNKKNVAGINEIIDDHLTSEDKKRLGEEHASQPQHDL